MKPKKRLLILTSATGAGHDTHAEATRVWCEKLFGDSVSVTIDHTLEKSHWLYSLGVDFYNLIQRKAPWFHHVYYNVIELLELTNDGTILFGKEYYVALLKEVQPDAILSVHDCLNSGYFEEAKKQFPSIRCATYCVEFEGGYGFSRGWVNPRKSDFFWGRTVETLAPARRRKTPESALQKGGNWSDPRYYLSPLSPKEKEQEREKLGLDPNRFTLLLSTGGNGANNHQALLQELLPLGHRLQVIALCGRNEKAFRELTAWKEINPGLGVRPLEFTNQMVVLYQIASAVIARPGATSAGEALLCRCPIIFNTFGGIMPQELPTTRYFRNRKIAACISSGSGLKRIVERWLDFPAEYQAWTERMSKARDDQTPELSLRALLQIDYR